MTRFEVFVEEEKKTPEILNGMDDILNDYCGSFEYNHSPLNCWTWINCETIAYDCVRWALKELSGKCSDTLIAVRCNDGAGFWSEWFLNGDSDYKQAEITFGDVDEELIKNYEGEVI